MPLLNAHFNLGLLHEARGQTELAIQEYKKEQETCPFNSNPDFNLGLLFIEAKELEKAIKEFESCIEKNEKFANAHVFLAKAYMDTNRDLNQAASLAQKGIDLNPDQNTTVLAHFVLADIYNRLGRHRESQQHLSLAKKLQKNL